MFPRLWSEFGIVHVKVTMAVVYTLGKQILNAFPLAPTLGLKWRKRCEIVLKCMNPPVGFLLTHIHAHTEICVNLTLALVGRELGPKGDNYQISLI